MVNPIVPNMYLYLFEGSTICVTNTILLLCIMGNAKNRSRREFLLIAAQSVADTLYAISFMLMAEYRLMLVAEGLENTNRTVWECALNPALPVHDIATPLLGLLPLTTSVNFLLCSLAPLWYLRAGRLYTLILISTPHVLTLGLVGINYGLIWGSTTSMSALCVAAKGAADGTIYGIMLVLRLTANLASAIIYTVILIYLRYNSKRCLQEMTAQQKKTHRNATITLGFVTLNSFTLLFIPDALLFFNPWNIIATQSTPLYSMTLSKTMINFFIYMWRYRELAEMVMSATCRRIPQLNRFLPSREASQRILSTAPNRTMSTVRETGTGFSSVRRFSMKAVEPLRRTSAVAPGISRPRPAGVPVVLKPLNVETLKVDAMEDGVKSDDLRQVDVRASNEEVRSVPIQLPPVRVPTFAPIREEDNALRLRRNDVPQAVNEENSDGSL